MDEITIAEAAEILGVTTRQVARYIEAGKLPARTIGERVKVIPREAVENFQKTPVGNPAWKKKKARRKRGSNE